MKSITPLCVILFFIASLHPSMAVITPVNSYHLGDLDTNAANSVTTIASADYIGSNAVSFVGSSAYSTDVPDDYPLPDTYSLNFTGTNYGVASVLTNVTDNFGIQTWVKVRSTGGNRCIAYNGNEATNGWGLFLVGDTFQGEFGGVTFIGSAPVQTNVWTHLALVRDSGVATLYVNGLACETNSAAPIAPDGAWTLGASPLAGGEYFDGLIDEVQVFTFSPGTFSTNDLAYCSPDSRQLSPALNGTNFVINWPAARSDMQLQYTTNLASGVWTTLSYSTNNNQYTVTDTPGDCQRFYRLVKPSFDTVGFVVLRLPMIRHQISDGRMFTNFPVLYNDPGYADISKATKLNSLTFDFTFDASSVVNPRTGTAEAINYHWFILYPTVPGFTDAGIHGYQRSMLHIDQSALAQTMGGSVITVRLDVSDKLDPNPLHGRATYFVATASSDLTLSAYTACQQPGVQVCPTCACQIAAATPLTDPNDPP
jgi:Concanavalin A-like lectin/glucanases superfamily